MSNVWKIEYSRSTDGTVFLTLNSVRQLARMMGHQDLVREYDTLELELATGILQDGGTLPEEGTGS